MPAPTTLLFIGLQKEWAQSHTTDQFPDPDTFYAKLQKTFDALDRVPDLHIEHHNTNPEDPDDFEVLKTTIREGMTLNGSKKSWDGIMIGAGIRTILPLTPLFQELVNHVHETLPAAKMIFSSSPDDHLEAIKRSLEIDEK